MRRSIRATVRPADLVVELRPGEDLAGALVRAGVELETPCGGQGTCGGCRIRIEAPGAATPPTGGGQARPEWRRACRTFPSADVDVWMAAGPDEVSQGAGVVPGRTAPPEPVGLAVDLGTTTLEAAMVGLRSGRELAREATLNPQTRFGSDVMSRIALGSTPEGLARLVAAVRGGLGQLVGRLAARCGVQPRGIDRAVAAGNATMLQLAMGLDPAPLGRTPWRLTERGAREVPAARLGLSIRPEAPVYVPPVPQAFFGADATAGLATQDGFFEAGRPRMFVDLGTNGELALSAGGRVWCSSAAAGPAFEGGGMSCGMRAIEGAVQAVDVIGGELIYETIGRGAVRGVCGSGLIELLVGLREIGVIEPSGRMPRGGHRVADGVRLMPQDVRQAQLAKAAVRVGIDALLEVAGIGPGELEGLTVAGAFGRALRPHRLEAIGMIPSGLADRVSVVGNSSLAGATRLLLEPAARGRLERRLAGLEHMPLAGRSDFQERFLAALAFPG